MDTAAIAGRTRKRATDPWSDQISEAMAVRLRDGFAGQRMWVVPRPWAQSCASHPVLQTLLLSDIGWFPNARFHYRERARGADEHILIYCSQGIGSAIVGGVLHDISAGEALLIPRGTAHAYWANGANPWSIHWAHFTGIIGDLVMSEFSSDHCTIALDEAGKQAVEALFTECFSAFAAGFVMHHMIYSAQVLHHLLGKIIYGNPCYSPLQRAPHRRTLGPTLTFLHQNSMHKLSLKEIADHAGISVSHLSALFKEQTGLSPMDYLIRYRMQRACALLTLQSMNINEVAYEVGYEDPYYFSRLFKKVIGVSPLHYRTNQTSSAKTNAVVARETAEASST